MTLRRRLGTVVLSLGLALGEREINAGSPLRPAVEVTVIQATFADGGGFIDPRLAELASHAHEQPFLRFNTFKLLDRKELPIQVGKAVVDPLVNGRTLEITLLDVTDHPGDRRFHLRAEIDEPGKQALLKLLQVTAGPNVPFFLAGQAFRGGTLFLEIVVRE